MLSRQLDAVSLRSSSSGRTPTHHHSTAARGGENESPAPASFVRLSRRLHGEVTEDCPQNSHDLEVGERSSWTAPCSSTKRDPRIRPRRCSEEAVGVELVSVRVDRLVAVYESDAGGHDVASRNDPRAKGDGRSNDLARDGIDDGPSA